MCILCRLVLDAQQPIHGSECINFLGGRDEEGVGRGGKIEVGREKRRGRGEGEVGKGRGWKKDIYAQTLPRRYDISIV